MSKDANSWTVLKHGPIERLEPNLWRVEGTIKNMGLKRVMTIVRLESGQLVIHNGICLSEEAMQEIEAWGQPAFIVVPNGYHRLDCGAFKERYPQAKIICPAAATKRVSQAVPVDLSYDDFPENPKLSFRHAEGTGLSEGVMTVRHGDTATVVLNDLVFNMPHESGFGGFLLRYLTASSGGPRISRLGKLLMVKDKGALADDLEKMADTHGLARVIVSHHRVIDEKPAEVLREVAASLR